MLKFFIHKPIGVLMTILAVVILGGIASSYVPVSLMPDIDIPEITIQVQADNMSAREMEDVIVNPLRSNLIQTSNLEDIKSEATTGNAVIRLHFTHGTNIDYAFIEVNEKLDRTMATLPREIERPRVIKASATDIPVFYLNLTLKEGEATTPNGQVTEQFMGFSQFANKVVKKRIEQVPEVAMVDISGLIFPEIIVKPDYEQLRALGMSLEELELAIKNQSIEVGSILVKDNQYQYNLRVGANLTNIRDIENIHIKIENRILQLKDLAQITKQPQKRTGLSLFNNKEAITMAVIKQGDARMSDFKNAVEKSISYMEKDHPDIEFSIVRDQARLLDYSINNLGESLLWGGLLAFLVMFLFLTDLKSPFLIGISVPVSLVVTLLFFHLLHISINIISLSGLILGTGLMIDNAIIVIDNITQYREMGYPLSEACVKATNDVFTPLLSSVLTTCAVFIPLIFLSGITGALFYDQAMAITIGLFVSLLVSVTLLPVLYRLFHLKSKKEGRIANLLKRVNALNYALLYEKGFRLVMRKQQLFLFIVITLLITTVSLFTWLPKTQMPELSSQEILLKIDWNEPLNVEENKKRVLLLMGTIKGQLENYNSQVGTQQFLMDKNAATKSSQANIYLQATGTKELAVLKHGIIEHINGHYPKAVIEYAEVDNIFNLIFSDDQAPLTARLRNVEGLSSTQNGSFRELWDKLNQELDGIPVQPIAWEEQITLLTNREKMMIYGVNLNQLNTTLRSAFNEKEVLSIVDNQDFVPVVLGGEVKSIKEVLRQIQVRANDSSYYHISEFVTPVPSRDLKTLVAGKQGVYYPIDLNITDVQKESTMKKIKTVVGLNPQYEVSFTGSLFKSKELVSELIVVLLITLGLLYFILASQFESLTLPLVILLEIPISMAGALLFLFFFGMSLNLMSMIGIVVMSGIVINDSILKIDTIIQLQRQGNSLIRALLIAGQRRLKPILMTSISTILALVPVLFTGGIGGELQASLAVTLLGGMLLGTIVSLYLIPLCYYYLAKNKLYAKK